jgi:hypothetical protein
MSSETWSTKSEPKAVTSTTTTPTSTANTAKARKSETRSIISRLRSRTTSQKAM